MLKEKAKKYIFHISQTRRVETVHQVTCSWLRFNIAVERKN